ncbi:DUF948 domain-containing protein [Pseudoxanthomonas sp.]|uniref:DUF948 domain-containing protein n=1 Tax=Pseudoxanthomonas sp. TaxID=1871049 RepID=UPI002625A637|nr:DUF948 domain-containing protein [Pseudoxanthomonas sp.]WDS36208.1 MAG: DUF948 domain-containing protein [Pseudoxanthomonas sp.]
MAGWQIYALSFLVVAAFLRLLSVTKDTNKKLESLKKEVNYLHTQLEGHWRGHNYFHAQTRALIKGDPPPSRSDFWPE